MKWIIKVVLPTLLTVWAQTSMADELWAAFVTVDPSNNKSECIVSTNDFPSSDTAVTSKKIYYPFVQKKDGVLMVGVRSGGKNKVPVGNAKLRVDAHKPYEIFVTGAPTNKPDLIAEIMKGNDSVFTTAQEKDSTESTQQPYQGVVPPITMVTDERAESLLAEMKSGRNLIYQAGLSKNVPGMESSIGVVKFNESFLKALQKCEIN